MRDTERKSRPVVTYVPLAAAVLGITIVLTSVVFFFEESDIRRLGGVIVGLVILIAGVWYAANPFLRNTRRYVPLRREVDAFIELVRTVNRQVLKGDPPADVEATKAVMHEAVERMVTKAGESV
jgi:HAMP domain-containing protein